MTVKQLALASAVLIFCAVLLAGCGRMTVSGRLVIRSGFGAPSQPLSGSTIVAVASSGRAVQRVQTAADGSFSLVLGRGFYTVELLLLVGGPGPAERIVVGVGRYAPAHDRRVHLLLVWR